MKSCFDNHMKHVLPYVFDSNIGWPRKLTFDLEAEILVTALYETSQRVLAYTTISK